MERVDLRTMLGAYAVGAFPMADAHDADELFWVEPKLRAVFPLDRFQPSRSLKKAVRQDRFAVTADGDFDAVVTACAESADGREETWINAQLRDAYTRLHALGHAHSIECRDQRGAIVGGLFGVTLGRAFFGESMFSRARDASKVALVHLVARLRLGGYSLLDCQFMTNHLASLGAVAVPQRVYRDAMLYPSVAGVVSRAGVALGAGTALGAGGGLGGALGSAERGVADGRAAGVGRVGDWGALDRWLAAGAPFDEAGEPLVPVASDPDGASISPVRSSAPGTSTSPGHSIAQLFTNTS